MLKEVLEIYDLLDDSRASGEVMKRYLEENGAEDVEVNTLKGEKGSTDFIKITIKGSSGKAAGGSAPTLGIIGRLGGLGARPEVIGFVSDGDGALAALSAALKLVKMQKKGDILKGDVIVSTHICPDAPTRPHFPVPFMGAPVGIEDMNRWEIDKNMDAILSIDTTKGNKIINNRGFAISPTIKSGYILKVSDDLVEAAMKVKGDYIDVFPVSQQDITPYGNGLYHINSILQPAVATSAPVVGVAITTRVPVAGCATGATHEIDVELASRYVVEVAKDFGEGKCSFYDTEEHKMILDLYGGMERFQTRGE